MEDVLSVQEVKFTLKVFMGYTLSAVGIIIITIIIWQIFNTKRVKYV